MCLLLLHLSYDYENVESGPALQMMAHLEAMALDATLLGKTCVKLS